MNNIILPRHYFLDWLRILAFGLLVPFHVGMYYVSWDWHVKSPVTSAWLEPLMLLSSPWRLGLLFLIAGAAARLLLDRSEGFVAVRSKRLLLPLVFGMFVIVPPQAFFEVQTQAGYTGSYLDFWWLYVTGYQGFCDQGGDCLAMPAWNHLWFLAYLWVYSLQAWLLWLAWPAAFGLLERCLVKPRGVWFVLLVMALPLMLARQLVGWFEPTHNLVWDWYNHAQYGGLFLLGLLAARSSLWTLMQQWRRWALFLALLAWLILVTYFKAFEKVAPPDVLRYAMRCLWGALEWWAIAAACGYAKQWLNFDHAWRRWLNSAIFCVYILHQTVIVLLTRALLPLALPLAVEGPLLIALTFALCLLAYLGLRRVPWFREALGIFNPAPRRGACAELPMRPC